MLAKPTPENITMEVIAPHRENALKHGREPMILLDNSLMSPRAEVDKIDSCRPFLVSRKIDKTNSEIRLDEIAEMAFGISPGGRQASNRDPSFGPSSSQARA